MTIKEQDKDIVIPSSLIYEEIDGEPIPYAGYEEVLNGTKTLEEIMGSSSLQAKIIRLLLKFLYRTVDGDGYEVYTNESGLHVEKGSNFAGDILIYESKRLENYDFKDSYFDIPPKIIIEIDTKADVKDILGDGYLARKTRKLHEWGVEKIFWLMTDVNLIVIAAPDEDWLIRDWNKDVELWDEVVINIGELLKK